MVSSNGVNGVKDDDKKSKGSKHKKRTRRGRSKSCFSSCSIPTSLVCSPAEAVIKPGAIEAGLIVSMLIMVLYCCGVYESVISLPDVPPMPDFYHHMGENLNAALNNFDSVGPGTNLRSLEKNSVKNNQQAAPVKQASPSVVEIPPTKWPVSIREEKNDFETILHPGDMKTEMQVPKFWSYPVHNNELMSRETAMKIGSCIEPDASGNYARGDDCPLDKRTIYIGIASYRDYQCRLTIESVFKRAKYPERLRVGVVDQIVLGEDDVCDEPVKPCDEDPEQALCKYKDQVDLYHVDAQFSVGPVFARHIGYRMYRGEYYATQSDAHVTYTANWDVDIIEQLEQTHNEMAVLSTYLSDIQGSIDKEGRSLRNTRPIMCNTHWEGGVQGMHLRHGSQPERKPLIHGTPQLAPWWAAGYSFSRGHFIVNVPYDWLQPMIFQGEEMSIGIRGFTVGYDYYAPERSVCFHHYAVGKNAKIRNRVHHFWENDQKYAGTGKKAMARLLGIVHMNPEVPKSDWDHTDEHIYGLGGVRTPEKFYKLYGIDVKHKKAEEHLCKFVDMEGFMHTKFTKFLRKDGMGIDYSNIHFRFKDPDKHQINFEGDDSTAVSGEDDQIPEGSGGDDTEADDQAEEEEEGEEN